MKVSIVVPAYNEAVNIPFLIEEFDKFIKKHRNYEVILVDDGSEDGTSSIAEEHKRGYLKVVRHKRNMGKTQAIISGTKAARGDVIVIFDADLQYDPDDIPRLVELIENGADVATGWKQGDYDKKFVSRIYNSWARRLFDLEIHDMNSVKAFKKELINDIPLRKDWHRYIVPLAKDAGYKIQEVKVTLRPRKYGSPKYQSKFRILIGLFDLLAVKFQLTFMQKPLLYFGTIGLFSFAFFAVLYLLIVQKQTEFLPLIVIGLAVILIITYVFFSCTYR